jgi:chemotaxis signal transduction protein
MTIEAQQQTALRFTLDSGPCSLALSRIDHLTGYASLTGPPDDYFLGWLAFHGKLYPVFDLNRVICEAPTRSTFGARILLVNTGPEAPVPVIGLLASGATDTISLTHPDIKPLDVDNYLPMLFALIPKPPAGPA